MLYEVITLKDSTPDLTEWRAMVDRIINPMNEVTIGIVGKYVELKDAYMSIMEALGHAGAKNDTKVNINWVNAEELENKNYKEVLDKLRITSYNVCYTKLLRLIQKPRPMVGVLQ